MTKVHTYFVHACDVGSEEKKRRGGGGGRRPGMDKISVHLRRMFSMESSANIHPARYYCRVKVCYHQRT